MLYVAHNFVSIMSGRYRCAFRLRIRERAIYTVKYRMMSSCRLRKQTASLRWHARAFPSTVIKIPERFSRGFACPHSNICTIAGETFDVTTSKECVNRIIHSK